MKLKVLKNKKIIISILLLIIGSVAINYTFFKPTKINFYIASRLYKTPANTAFTDDNFYKCVVIAYNNKNNTLEPFTANLTDEQLQTITSISCSSIGIVSADGLEKLTKLEYLELDKNNLTSLDISNNSKLSYLKVDGNQLTSLDVSNNLALLTLIVGSYSTKNQLTHLDVSNNTSLERLTVSGNQLTSLDVSNNLVLESLSADNNRLTSLDVSNNPKLSYLNVDRNQLTSLDVSHNPTLEHLDVENNKLTSLDVNNNLVLKELIANENKLENIDVSNNPELQRLWVDETQLTTIDVSNNPTLKELSVAWNALTTIDLSKNLELTSLDVSYNKLTTLDVGNYPKLKYLYISDNKLTTLDVSNNATLEGVDVSGNQLTNLDVSNNTSLTSLDVSLNQLTSLDVSNNTSLTSLNVRSNKIEFLDLRNNIHLISIDLRRNKLTSLDLSNNINLSFPNVFTYISDNPFGEEKYIYKGESIQLGSNIKLPSKVSVTNNWESKNNSIAVVDNNGIATALKAGIVTLTNKNDKYTSTATLNIVEITSDRYIIDDINNYIICDDLSFDTIKEHINVPENIELEVDSENKMLQVKYNEYLLKEFTLIGLASDEYNLTKEYIYIGTEELDLTKIHATNSKIIEEKGKVKLEYNDEIVKEFDIIALASDRYDLTKDYIYVEEGNIDLTKITSTNAIITEEENKLQVKYKEEIVKQFDIVSISSDVYDLTKNYIYIETEELELTKINVTNAIITEEDNKIKVKYNDEIIKEFDIVKISSEVYNLTKEYIYIGTKQLDITKINTTNATIVEEDNKLNVKYSNEVLKEFDIVSISSEVYDLTKDYIYIRTKQLDLTKINVTNGTIIKEDNQLQLKYNDQTIKEFDIVSITSDKYDLTKDYIYVGTEQLDLTKINATNATIIKEDAQLQLKYDDTILKTWDIISISQEKYLLGNNYIYIGTNELDLEKINITNATLINEDEKLKVKYNDKTIYEYNILSINFNELVINKNLITVPQNMSYEDFASNITPNGVTYKIFNKEAEVTEGTITKDMVLKIYKDDKEIYEYQITDEFLDLSLLNVDEENLLIKDLKLGTTISSFKEQISTSGSVKILDQDGKELKDTDLIRSGAKVVIELSKDKYEYTLSVKGDITGTGTSTVSDVGKLYQYLRKKITMDLCYVEAGNVIDTDNEIKITDVGKLYQFIKGKIESLED